jgi:hypothetical protein
VPPGEINFGTRRACNFTIGAEQRTWREQFGRKLLLLPPAARAGAICGAELMRKNGARRKLTPESKAAVVCDMKWGRYEKCAITSKSCVNIALWELRTYHHSGMRFGFFTLLTRLGFLASVCLN